MSPVTAPIAGIPGATRRSRRAISLSPALLIGALLASPVNVISAQPPARPLPSLDRDTPADVQKAGANAVIEIDNWVRKLTTDRAGLVQQRAAATSIGKVDDQLAALKEARTVMAKMGADVNHATQILSIARKNDLIGLKRTLTIDAMKSTMAVDEVKDFTLKLSFTVRGTRVSVCGSNEGGCSGGRASVVVY